MCAKKHDPATILHVRLPIGLKDKLKQQAKWNAKTLGAHVTDILLTSLRSPDDRLLEAQLNSYKLQARLGQYALNYVRWAITSYNKRMRKHGRKPDTQLLRNIARLETDKSTRRAVIAMKRRDRRNREVTHDTTRSMDQVFHQTRASPSRLNESTVYDRRWFNLVEALKNLKRGELGRFATAVGISSSMLSRYRSPRTSKSHRRITKEVAHRMAAVLGIDSVAFDGWDQEKDAVIAWLNDSDKLVQMTRNLESTRGHTIKKRAPYLLSKKDRNRY